MLLRKKSKNHSDTTHTHFFSSAVKSITAETRKARQSLACWPPCCSPIATIAVSRNDIYRPRHCCACVAIGCMGAQTTLLLHVCDTVSNFISGITKLFASEYSLKIHIFHPFLSSCTGVPMLVQSIFSECCV